MVVSKSSTGTTFAPPRWLSLGLLSTLLVLVVGVVYFVYILDEIAPFQPLRHDSSILETKLLVNEKCEGPAFFPSLKEPDNSMPPGLIDYISFHREKRVCIEDPWSTPCAVDPPQIIVWESEMGRSGGFGDRIIAIRIMLMISIMTRRLFLIDWKQPSVANFALTSALLPAYINWTITEEDTNALLRRYTDQNKTVTDILLQGHHLGGIRHPVNHSHDDPCNFRTINLTEMFAGHSIIRVQTVTLREMLLHLLARNTEVNSRYVAGLQGLTVKQLTRTLTGLLFRPTAAVEFLVRRRTFKPGTPYIAVHARTGKDLFEEKDGRFDGLDSQYHSLAKRLLTCVRRINPEQKHVFLASDSIELKGIVEYHARRMRIQANTNRRIAWHLDRGGNDKFNSTHDNCIAFLDVFADSFALSQATTIAYFPSNFPRISIGLGNAITENWFLIDQRSELNATDCTPATSYTEWEELDEQFIKELDV